MKPEFNQYKSNPNCHLSSWCKRKSWGRLGHLAPSGNVLGPHQLSLTCSSPCVREGWCLWRRALGSTSMCAGQMLRRTRPAAAGQGCWLRGFRFLCFLHPALFTASPWHAGCLWGFSDMSHPSLPLSGPWHNSQRFSGASTVKPSARGVQDA